MAVGLSAEPLDFGCFPDFADFGRLRRLRTTGTALARPGDLLAGLLIALGLLVRLGGLGYQVGQALPQRVGGELGVPDLQVAHRGELGHRLAIRANRRHGGGFRVRRGESVVPRGDGEARGEPFDVELERAGQGLVEVVEIEHQPPLRRSIEPEVGQVGVTAQLDVQPGRRRPAQVVRHDGGRTPVEGERRHRHPTVAHRHQVLFPPVVLSDHQLDRIRPVIGGHPPTGRCDRCVSRHADHLEEPSAHLTARPRSAQTERARGTSVTTGRPPGRRSPGSRRARRSPSDPGPTRPPWPGRWRRRSSSR